MNLHGYLAKNKIMYESEEAKEFASSLISLKSSVHDTENVSIRHVNIRILFFMMIN